MFDLIPGIISMQFVHTGGLVDVIIALADYAIIGHGQPEIAGAVIVPIVIDRALLQARRAARPVVASGLSTGRYA